MPDARLKSRPVEPVKRGFRKNAALVVFGIIVVLAPLAFGAVDRAVQMPLALLLALGVFLYPPVMVPPGRRAGIVLLSVVAVLVLKELLPWQWFGGVRWRPLAEALGIGVAGTHHPEPARALDAWLVALVAAVWFQWVRTMAAEREMRAPVAWLLAAAGVAMAGVCFLTPGTPGPNFAIYGIRYAPSWSGWGPFPNRNHTASFLAMSAVMGIGCTVWAGMRGRKRLAVFSTACVLMTIVALLTGKSRGGLLALAVGLAVFCGLVLWKHRDRRTVAVVIAGVAVVAVAVAVFGGKVMERVFAEEGTHVSNQLRLDVWKNAIVMWRDAPLLGHGVQTFGGVFPFYQRLTLDDNVVLHPESSWLQWLCELGMLPVVAVVLLALALLRSRLGNLLHRQSGFFIGAGALAGLAAAVVHCAIDVPGHRWGTAGYALALFAIVCPVAREVRLLGAPVPLVALVPLLTGIYWLLPFVGIRAPWQPVTIAQLQAAEASGRTPRPSLEEWNGALRFFPLSRELHHEAAMRELAGGAPKTSAWQRHIEAVHRLTPGGWRYPISHARAVKRISPTLCIHYWQVAIGRGGWRATEMLGNALAETAGLPGAGALWENFVTANPRLALAYARLLREGDTQPLFRMWWKARGASTDLSDDEVKDFYRYGRLWASGEEILGWMSLHAHRRKADFRVWADLLQSKGLSERAWQLCAGRMPDPGYPSPVGAGLREEIEARIRIAPDNSANYADLARVTEQGGDREGANRIVLEFAAKEDAPSWFLRRGAHVLAADGKFREAVEMILRDR